MNPRSKENINDVLRGLNWLADEKENDNARIVAGALNELDYHLYDSPWIHIDFANFCESTEIDQDDLREAMDESL